MFQNGWFRDELTLPPSIRSAIEAQDWGQLDQLCAQLIEPSGALFERLFPIARQGHMEFIISLRDANNEWEEDGIWHDDGSRALAFSLGLNLRPSEIAGGQLRLRKKGESQWEELAPPAFGELLVFRTGVDNYEHMVCAVTAGQRLVMAGWCYR